MVRMESDCLGCDWPGGCGGCQYRGKSLHIYCDECDDELSETAYRHIDSDECLCVSCAEKAGAFDEDGDLIEDEWELFDALQDAADREESAREAYEDWLCDVAMGK